eukprot:TRINITY_DN5020_c0_g1_i1.p1 TRINITY_DN5020_c0_g1~~TRINITY_DN5020_c0_g1_i1.p1  ORF type:complete len:779 (-),score=182.58 TRINITY_DN5020_c0_g1_i1:71-2386(-)
MDDYALSEVSSASLDIKQEDDSQAKERNEMEKATAAFRQFLSTKETLGLKSSGFAYKDQILAHYKQGEYAFEVNWSDFNSFSPEYAEDMKKKPEVFVPLMEDVARKQIMQDLIPAPKKLEEVETMQMTLRGFPLLNSDDYDLSASSSSSSSSSRSDQKDRKERGIRALSAMHVAKLVCVRGIVVQAAKTRVKATSLYIQCRSCRSGKYIKGAGGFGSVTLPRVCDARDPKLQQEKCALDPFEIVNDKCTYVNQQRLKLQECPEDLPTGQLPRSIDLACERYLVDKVNAGSRVTVVGVFSTFQARESKNNSGKEVGIRVPYLRVLGIQQDTDLGDEEMGKSAFQEDESDMKSMAREEELYEKFSRSIAPAIYGLEDIKKALACQLFSGSRKQLPDGMRLRGDINILLLGDPSVAKSQFLKFIHRVAPVGVYTSGKGCSAAGLTAAVLRDSSTGEFHLEGGALVLADGGIVCIDEFDKMRVQDRVAIHEAMEQQTISIAKAGITTVLNSRCSVLAAANPIFGRYDDLKTPTENIDFQSTILSRFDLIFVVRDIQDPVKDKNLVRYIINVHKEGNKVVDQQVNTKNIFEYDKLKRYIRYARIKVHPHLSEEAAKLLQSEYVKLRTEYKKHQDESGSRGKSAIPITVRQLEAIIRVAEGLARMHLSTEATIDHVKEALRLFQVSTFQAATTGGSDALSIPEFGKKVQKAERAIRMRVPISTQTSYAVLIKALTEDHGKGTGGKFEENVVIKALDNMKQRGEFQPLHQGKTLLRLK